MKRRRLAHQSPTTSWVASSIESIFGLSAECDNVRRDRNGTWGGGIVKFMFGLAEECDIARRGRNGT
ncbi:hypothetical protein JTE90_026749 [Oedothorax gibbosus]|uniref:Uncharacterized protein n=1 Tax=Oedothorax gibbosus TaxID=931172 RepID=A0AAV6TQP8_9ARAC|nr:hypothetical protein JTE90_026749 [Oedothorax gibbosus]